MSVRICGAQEGSIAQRHGLGDGFILHTINGHSIRDVLDYRFYMVERHLVIELSDPAGQPVTVKIRKGEYDDLGLEFTTYLMDKQHTCANDCMFCFVNQMPQGMRDSLYIKDDDSRMSFLFGSYVTLTNLKEEDIRRIIKMRISPINISVHTTDPVLRVKMMKNRFAGEVLRFIPMLTEAGIKVNAQLVLCPGVNDGPQLERSLCDLCKLAPNLQSLAVVPVGLTSFREKLPQLRLFTPQEAQQVVSQIQAVGDEMQALHGVRIAYAADEFYLKAGLPIPDSTFYGDFEQLENGVGLVSMLTHEFEMALEGEGETISPRRITLATGTAAGGLLDRLVKKAQSAFPGLEAEVVPIRNDYFGPTITVAGLVTGTDLCAQLAGRPLGDELLLPMAMLRHEKDRFLDDYTVPQVEKALGCTIRLVENDGFDLLDALLGR
ncbi:DUF512 domain-containing protein [Oscillospiraceae bacterium MB08-C2-2]|nr:DUF512 domain-containing protein [Oscillospiraceae bacterium MB08-C2-2]